MTDFCPFYQFFGKERNRETNSSAWLLALEVGKHGFSGIASQVEITGLHGQPHKHGVVQRLTRDASRTELCAEQAT
jgi:hypothetical protein